MDDKKEGAVPGWLVSMLVCPEEKGQKLALVGGERLEGLNRRIGGGGLKNRGGNPVTDPLEEGLLREDGKVIYAVRKGIPDLIVDDGILLQPGEVE